MAPEGPWDQGDTYQSLQHQLYYNRGACHFDYPAPETCADAFRSVGDGGGEEEEAPCYGMTGVGDAYASCSDECNLLVGLVEDFCVDGDSIGDDEGSVYSEVFLEGLLIDNFFGDCSAAPSKEYATCNAVLLDLYSDDGACSGQIASNPDDGVDTCTSGCQEMFDLVKEKCSYGESILDSMTYDFEFALGLAYSTSCDFPVEANTCQETFQVLAGVGCIQFGEGDDVPEECPVNCETGFAQLTDLCESGDVLWEAEDDSESESDTIYNFQTISYFQTRTSCTIPNISVDACGDVNLLLLQGGVPDDQPDESDDQHGECNGDNDARLEEESQGVVTGGCAANAQYCEDDSFLIDIGAPEGWFACVCQDTCGGRRLEDDGEDGNCVDDDAGLDAHSQTMGADPGLTCAEVPYMCDSDPIVEILCGCTCGGGGGGGGGGDDDGSVNFSGKGPCGGGFDGQCSTECADAFEAVDDICVDGQSVAGDDQAWDDDFKKQINGIIGEGCYQFEVAPDTSAPSSAPATSAPSAESSAPSASATSSPTYAPGEDTVTVVFKSAMALEGITADDIPVPGSAEETAFEDDIKAGIAKTLSGVNADAIQIKRIFWDAEGRRKLAGKLVVEFEVSVVVPISEEVAFSASVKETLTEAIASGSLVDNIVAAAVESGNSDMADTFSNVTIDPDSFTIEETVNPNEPDENPVDGGGSALAVSAAVGVVSALAAALM